MRSVLCALMVAALGACVNSAHQTNTEQPYLLDLETASKAVRPYNTSASAIIFEKTDPLFRAVALDSVDGLPARSFFSRKPTEPLYRSLLNARLADSGLKAANSDTARFKIDVEFTEILTGREDKTYIGEATALYHVIDTRNGRSVFKREVKSNIDGAYSKLLTGSKGGGKHLRTYIIRQNIDLFLTRLGQQQNVPVTHFLACNKYYATPELMTRIALGDIRVRSDDCMKYVPNMNKNKRAKFVTWN